MVMQSLLEAAIELSHGRSYLACQDIAQCGLHADGLPALDGHCLVLLSHVRCA